MTKFSITGRYAEFSTKAGFALSSISVKLMGDCASVNV